METGECLCGAVSYRLTSDDPVLVYACHCLNCQKRSGSAFAEHVMYPAGAFQCEGPVATYSSASNGIDFEDVLCATCHTRIYNRNSMLEGMIFLRAGTLSGSASHEPMAHIWTRRKQPWIAIPEGIPSFEESPTPEEFGLAVQQALAQGWTNSSDR